MEGAHYPPMKLSVGFVCFLAVAFHEVGKGDCQHFSSSGQHENTIADYNAKHADTRIKRAWQSVVTRGLQNAFNGARKYGESKKIKVFQKPGTFETAKTDFYGFFPRNVRQPLGEQLKKHGQVYFGEADHIQLRLYEKGTKASPSPMLEITHIGKRSGKKIDRIFYKDFEADY